MEDENRQDNLNRYYKLRGKIRYFKFEYYVCSRSPVPDHVYDAIEKEFDGLAEKLGLPGSWIGYDPTK